MTGIDILLRRPPLPFSAGTRIGLLAHAASLTCEGQHTALALAECRGCSLIRLFSPEHGFFGAGAAGETIHSESHPVLHLPIHSLYGEHRSPPAEWLEDLDLLVIDLQDLGVRCYTYASTLQNVLRAAAACGCPVMVLDRPTPFQGIVDGPNLDPAYSSFVGQIPLPLVYGLSQGPLAEFLKTSDSRLRALDLTVIPAGSGRGLPWHPPSPGLPSKASAELYPVTVWCEAIADVSVERGGPRSFQLWAMPDLDPEKLAATVSFEGLDAVPSVSRENWPGLFFRRNGQPYAPVRNAVRLLAGIRDQLGADRLFDAEASRPAFFDQLMGTASVRNALISGKAPEAIFALF